MPNTRVTHINKSFLDYIFKKLVLDKAQNVEMIKEIMDEVKGKLEEAMTDNGFQGEVAKIKWYRSPSDNMRRWNNLIEKHKPEDDQSIINVINDNPELY